MSSQMQQLQKEAEKSVTVVEEEVPKVEESTDQGYCGRERLKRHRMEMAGRVWIPDIWGQESLLKDWTDCSAFDSSLVPNGVVSARKALMQECRRTAAGSGVLRATGENDEE